MVADIWTGFRQGVVAVPDGDFWTQAILITHIKVKIKVYVVYNNNKDRQKMLMWLKTIIKIDNKCLCGLKQKSK